MNRGCLRIVTVAFHLDEDLQCFVPQGLPSREMDTEETMEASALANIRPFIEDNDCFVEQLYTFRDADFVAVVYYALVRKPSVESRWRWYGLKDLPPLKTLEKEMIDKAVERLRGKVRYQPIGFSLLPEKFTLSQLQRVYEVILSRQFDKRNFRKKLRTLNVVRELDEFQDNVPHRAARLYRLNERKARGRDLLV